MKKSAVVHTMNCSRLFMLGRTEDKQNHNLLQGLPGKLKSKIKLTNNSSSIDIICFGKFKISISQYGQTIGKVIKLFHK